MSTEVASLFATLSLKDNLTSDLSKARGGLDGFATTLGNVGTKMTAIGQAGQQMMRPIIGALESSVFAAMDFNAAMTNANSILQLSDSEIAKVSDEILNMGRNAIAGPQAVANAYYDIVGGVADTTTHMDILNTSIAVSEAGSSDLAGTTKTLVAVMNSYGFAAEEASVAGDVLTRITATGIGTMDEFGAALPSVTGLAASLGIAFDDVGSMMAFFTTKGFSASSAATMLQASMTALIKPNELLKDAYAELGVANGEALINMYGLDGAIQAVSNTSVAASEGLPALLGTVEALNAATTLGDEAWTGFDKAFHGATQRIDLPIFSGLSINLGAVDASIRGSTEAARGFQRASPSAQFKLLKAQVAGLAIEVGTALLPSLLDLFALVKPILVDITAWVQENPRLVVTLGAIAVGAAGLAGVLIPLGMAIILMGTAITGLAAGATLAASALALIVSPIGLIVLGIAALGIAYKTNFMGFADAVDSLVPKIETLARTAKVGFNTIAKNIEAKALPAIQDLRIKAQDLPSIFDGLNNIDIGNIFGGMVDRFNDFVNGWKMTNEQLGIFADYLRIAGVAIGLFVPYVGILIAVATALYTAYEINFLGFADLINSAAPIVGDALAQITGFFTGFIDSLKAGNIGSFIRDSIITPLITGLSGFLANTDLQAIASSIGASILSALKTGLDLAGKGATWIADNIINPLVDQASAFVSSGGLRDMMYGLGKGLMDALQLGIVLLGGVHMFIYNNIVKPLSDSIATYITSGAMWEDLKTFGSNIPKYIKDGLNALIAVNTFFNEQIVMPFIQGIADSLAGGVIWENLKSFGSQMIKSIKDAITTGIPNFISDNIVTPLTDLVTTTNWQGLYDAFTNIGNELINTFADSISGGVETIKTAINDIIPDKIEINIGSVTVGKSPFSKTIDFGSISIPLPNPFMTGTPWTGNMSRSTPAGIVHGQEAVIPTGGMSARVIPSPGGLQVQTRGLMASGGGGSGGMVIQNINIYGVQNVQELYDELQDVAAGRWGGHKRI